MHRAASHALICSVAFPLRAHSRARRRRRVLAIPACAAVCGRRASVGRRRHHPPHAAQAARAAGALHRQGAALALLPARVDRRAHPAGPRLAPNRPGARPPADSSRSPARSPAQATAPEHKPPTSRLNAARDSTRAVPFAKRTACARACAQLLSNRSKALVAQAALQALLGAEPEPGQAASSTSSAQPPEQCTLLTEAVIAK